MNKKMLVAIEEGDILQIMAALEASGVIDQPITELISDVQATTTIIAACKYVAIGIGRSGANDSTMSNLVNMAKLQQGAEEIQHNISVVIFTQALALLLSALLTETEEQD